MEDKGMNAPGEYPVLSVRQTVVAPDIQGRIMTIRGLQVLLDRDLAELYGVSTKALNQAVKRNAGRFPAGFMFRLTKDELADLRSQNVASNSAPISGVSVLRSQTVTSKRGGVRYCPYAFTEHGVVMLASLLKSATATEVSVRIVNAFVAMRKFILANAQVFQRIESVEQRQIATEGKVNEILDRLNTGEVPSQGVFYEGQLWDARMLVLRLIERAKRSIVLIDNWATAEVLDLFAKKRKGVKVTIITSEHFNKNHVPSRKISDADVKAFNEQYPKIDVRYNESFHDRFLIIDDSELYLIGASLKDLGRKCFGFTKMDGGDIRRIKKAAFDDSSASTCQNPKNERLVGLSLFANVGIAETYLRDVGVEIAVANELLPERARFYQHLYPNCNMICGDIQDVKVFGEIQRAAKKAGVEFVIATPPCQGMSPAGKKDTFDPRNLLITYAVDLIEHLRPKFVLIENVMQQLKTKIRYKGELFLIPDYLKERLGTWYHFNDNPVIDTKFYGIPQQRKRAIFLLARKDVQNAWQFPEREPKFVTLRDAIGDLPSLDPLVVEPEYRNRFPDYETKISQGLKVSRWHYPKAHFWRHIEMLQHTPEGQSARKNEYYYPKKSDGSRIKGAPRTYMRMSWDRPAPTITIQNASVTSFQTIHPGRPTREHGIYSDPRVLTIFELLRVTTLPDDWNIPAWATDPLIRRVIGEGIPPLLIKKLVAQLNLGKEM